MAAVAFIEAIAHGLAGNAHVDPLLTLGAIRLLETAMLITVLMVWGRGLASVGLARDQWIPGLKTGLVWSAGFGLLTFVVFAILLIVGINPFSLLKTPLPANTHQLVLFFLTNF